MQTVICTLFEGHYHLGVAAFVNSLHKHGYKGDIFAGYLGELPPWATATDLSLFDDLQLATYKVNDDIKIHFVKLKTTYHLANYKPDFLKWLFEGPARDVDNIFYFDPDIILDYDWAFYEEWVSFGVTVCEDVNSPLPPNHPRKMAWKKYFGQFDISLNLEREIYVNSGFIGVNKKDIGLVDTWIMIQEKIGPLIGGLSRAPFPGEANLAKEHAGDYAPFSKTDQDALNIAIGAWDGVVSFVGKEGMGLQGGATLMLHALGSPKPWRIKFLKQSFLGISPRSVDKKFWKCVDHPISLFNNNYVQRKSLVVSVGAFIGRFYTRN